MRRVIATLALVLAAPGSAAAFHDPEEFGHEAMRGGGAGKWFTGSPRFLGYDCTMCHTAGSGRARVTVESVPDGLFETGRYVPEAEYRITVRMAQAEVGEALPGDRNAFAAEVVLDDGAATTAGSLAPGDDRVELVDEGRVVGPSASFAKGLEWSFQWTAPPPGAGAVYLHVAAVDGNGDESSSGDDVATTAVRLGELGATQTIGPAGYDAACGASPGSPNLGVAGLLICAFAFLKRRVPLA